MFPFKSVLYTTLDELHDLVYVAILDEVKRTFRSAIRPSDTPKIIQEIPLEVPETQLMMGYLIIGLEENQVHVREIYKLFGATTPPEDIKQLNPSFEPVYIKNLAELKEGADAIKKANERSKAANRDRQKVFLREVRREASEIASHYVMRQETNTPDPEIKVPGIAYYIWALDPSLARLYKLMRLEGIVREPVQIQRIHSELLFRSSDHFIKATEALQKCVQESRGDDLEFRRLLLVEKSMMDYDDGES